MMCLSAFAGLQLISRLTLDIAARSEAQRVLQTEAERLNAADFSSFVASDAVTITSCLKTTFRAGSQAQFALSSDHAAGRVTFTRRVVEVSSTSTSRTLRVDVTWTTQGTSHTDSVLLFRAQ